MTDARIDAAEAAGRLAELLKEWQVTPAGRSAGAFRSDETGGWWAKHMEAVEWVGIIDEAMAEISESEHAVKLWRQASTEARRAIFRTPHGLDWSDLHGECKEIDDSPITMIGTIGELLGARRATGEAALTQARGLLGPVQDALREAENLVTAIDLADDERNHLLTLIEHCRHVMKLARIDDINELRAHLERLIGALDLVDAGSERTEDKKGVVRRLISSTKEFMGSPVVTNVLAAGTVLLAITAG